MKIVCIHETIFTRTEMLEIRNNAQLLIKKKNLFKVIVKAQAYDHFCSKSVGDVALMEQ